MTLRGHELEYRRNAFKPTLQNVIVLLPVTRKTRAHCESYGRKKARQNPGVKKAPFGAFKSYLILDSGVFGCDFGEAFEVVNTKVQQVRGLFSHAKQTRLT